MDDLIFVESTFDKSKTEEYNLSIRVGSDGFSFSILNVNKKCLALKRFKTFSQNSDIELLNSFKEQIRNSELLNLKYKAVSILWISDKSILIPNEFFTKEFAFNSYQICHELRQAETLNWNKIDLLEAYSVFPILVSLKELLHKQFPQAAIYHHTHPFYINAMKESMEDNHPSVFVNIHQDFFHVIIPDQGKKHFINSFSYKEDSDLAYYILNIYKQQKLNNERSKLIVNGLVQEKSKVILLLKKYLADVEVKHLPAELRIKNIIPLEEYNQFINLLNLSECE
ncbi:DUF3822 family protein [Marinifilum sp. RC60d5]|uniref:DUF3822 family protein n=1 Tax=Marinifilum sp. RC60d5 TaxID=3458414 RepID=UPI004036E6E5